MFDRATITLGTGPHSSYSHPRIASAIAEDLYFGRVIFYFLYFFPSTKFSTSLGRFSRNFATPRGICSNSLSPIGVFVRAP